MKWNISVRPTQTGNLNFTGETGRRRKWCYRSKGTGPVEISSGRASEEPGVLFPNVKGRRRKEQRGCRGGSGPTAARDGRPTNEEDAQR